MKSMYLTLALAALAVLLFQPAPDTWADEPRLQEFSETHDFGNLVDAAGETGSMVASGVVLGDYCVVISLGVDVAGATLTCYVSAANTVAYRLQNESGGALDLASTTVRVLIRRRA